MMSDATPECKLYCAWFCPFAQRAWIGLEYNGVKFEYVEQDPYEKTAEWLAVSPRGLVPSIFHNGKPVYDSTVCLEYIDEAWPTGKRLLPKEPYDRAYARIWMDHINKNMLPPYYAILMKTGEAQEEARAELLKGIETYIEAMKEGGPFFLGKEFGVVDIGWFPWALRCNVIVDHYRGFKLPEGGKYERYHQWYAAVKELPAVCSTLQSEERLIQKYLRYADDSAQTLVADAIRQGKAFP